MAKVKVRLNMKHYIDRLYDPEENEADRIIMIDEKHLKRDPKTGEVLNRNLEVLEDVKKGAKKGGKETQNLEV